MTDDAVPVTQPNEGRYSNYLKVGFTSFEFVIDFGQHYAGDDTEFFHTRVITAPRYAKEFAELLTQSITQYEASHGAIPPMQAGANEEKKG